MSDEFDAPLTDEAEVAVTKHDRRSAQGLDYYPFADGLGAFHKVGPEAGYTKENAEEVLRIVSSWGNPPVFTGAWS